MTIFTTGSRVQHTGNGVTTNFAFQKKFYSNSHILVTVTDPTTGVDVVKAENVDYTLTGAGDANGGTVTFGTAPVSNAVVTIERIIPDTQGSDYTEAGNFPAETNERDHDLRVMSIQEIRDILSRTLTIPSSTELGDFVLNVSDADRANKYLVFDAFGYPTVADLVVTNAPVSTYMSGILNNTSMFELRRNIGIPLSNFNFIINGSFTNDLVSLPAAPSDNNYIFPKWRVLMEGANAVVPSLGSGTIFNTDSVDGQLNFLGRRVRLTVGSANNLKWGIFQPIENRMASLLRSADFMALQAKLLRNASSGIGNVKMALLGFNGVADDIAASPISSWGAEGTNPTLATNWSYINTPGNLSITTTCTRYKVESMANTSRPNYGVLIWCDDRTTVTGDWIEVGDIKVESGKFCTEFTRPHLAEDELNCAREYESFAGQVLIGTGMAYSTTQARILVPMQVFKRVQPTLAVSSAGHFSLRKADGTLSAVSAISINTSSSTSRIIQLDVTLGSADLVAGNATQLVGSNASATLELRAHL